MDAQYWKEVLIIVSCSVTAGIAHRKGFRWYLWILPGVLGFIGLIVVLATPGAARRDMTPEESLKVSAHGNKVGATFSGILLAVVVILVVVGINTLREQSFFREEASQHAKSHAPASPSP